MPNKIPVVFHNGSNYDYHFIKTELVNAFKGHVIHIVQVMHTDRM